MARQLYKGEVQLTQHESGGGTWESRLIWKQSDTTWVDYKDPKITYSVAQVKKSTLKEIDDKDAHKY